MTEKSETSENAENRGPLLTPCALQEERTRPCRWVLTVDGPCGGADNMAKDHQRLKDQETPGALPSVRFYQWARPTVSYGRLQSRSAAEAVAQAWGAEEVVERPTGGGRVHHVGGVSFSLAWRRDSGLFTGGVREIYCAWHGVAAGFLLEQGINVTLHKTVSSRTAGDCFQEPVEADVMWKGRKVLGGALRVTRDAWLYQGDVRTALLGVSPALWAREFPAYLERVFFRAPPHRST